MKPAWIIAAIGIPMILTYNTLTKPAVEEATASAWTPPSEWRMQAEAMMAFEPSQQQSAVRDETDDPNL